jgi:hypothetical protein
MSGIVSLNKSNLIVLKLTMLRKESNICRFVVMYAKFGRLIAKRLYSVIPLSNFNKKSTSALIYSVTELILGRGGVGEEFNYDYFKLKRKGKERKSNASYFTINTSVCVR